MPVDIVLIGPVRTGKSTLGRLLAQALGLPQVSLDEIRLRYYKEIGFDEALAAEIRRQAFSSEKWVNHTQNILL